MKDDLLSIFIIFFIITTKLILGTIADSIRSINKTLKDTLQTQQITIQQKD